MYAQKEKLKKISHRRGTCYGGRKKGVWDKGWGFGALEKNLNALDPTNEDRIVLQRYGSLNHMVEEEPTVTPFEDIKIKDPEEEVVVVRGIVPIQWDTVNNNLIWDSYVTLPKMLQTAEHMSEEDISPPTEEAVKSYVQGNVENGAGSLIEFTSKLSVAKNILQKKKGFVFYIKIKRKYLLNSSPESGEAGWMAYQAAPYEIIYGEEKILNEQSEVVYEKMDKNKIKREATIECNLTSLKGMKGRKDKGQLTEEDRVYFKDLVLKPDDESKQIKKYLTN